jgi:acyl carrier protein
MTRPSLEQDIRIAIAAQARCDPERIGLHDDFEEDLGLDSLDRLDVLAAVEDELGLRIPDDLFSEIRSLDGVLQALDRRPREIAA